MAIVNARVEGLPQDVLYRLAMAKGIELERRREDHTPLDEAAFRRLTGGSLSLCIGCGFSLTWYGGLVNLVNDNLLPLPHITTVSDFQKLCSLLGAELKE